MPALYHEDPYMQRFKSRVLSCESLGDGKWSVVLENTCFYPTGGGQPSDTGRINGLPVVEVSQETEDGPIFHTLLSDAPIAGEAEGEIDWQRRYDHMQQHTGQHLLSYAIAERFGGYSLGLHVGEKDSYVDVETELEKLDEDMLRQLIADTDALIAADIPVHQFFPTEEELGELPLRKKPPYHAHLRIVHAGPEAVACCGTHLSSTGQVRLVHILSTARSHGNLRIFFLAGDRALRHARECMAQAEGTAADLSCGVSSLREMVERMKQDGQERQRELAKVKKELALCRLSAAAPVELKDGPVIVEMLEGMEMKQMQEAAAHLLKDRAKLVCLLCPSAKGVQAVVAAEPPFEAGKAFRALAAAFSGKGGGRQDFAQGLLQGGDREGALECLRAL